MVKRITLDSSVIVSSLLEKEPRHKEALRIWTAVVSGDFLAALLRSRRSGGSHKTPDGLGKTRS